MPNVCDLIVLIVFLIAFINRKIKYLEHLILKTKVTDSYILDAMPYLFFFGGYRQSILQGNLNCPSLFFLISLTHKFENNFLVSISN